jgi:hypothetical protein
MMVSMIKEKIIDISINFFYFPSRILQRDASYEN